MNAVKLEQKAGGWEVLETDERTIEELLEEAEALNAEENKKGEWNLNTETPESGNKAVPGKAKQPEGPDWLRDDTLDDVTDDPEEEEAILRRIQDELSMEVPQNIRNEEQEYEGLDHEPDDLMARFQSLGAGGGDGLDLPTVPKSIPGATPKPTFKVAPQEDGVDETETWCCEYCFASMMARI